MSVFAPRRNPTPLFAALASSLLLLGVLLAAGPEEMLAALPLLGLLVALVFRLYPGERLIARLARHFRRRRPRPVSVEVPARHATPFAFRLLSSLSAVRPLRGPPALSSLSI